MNSVGAEADVVTLSIEWERRAEARRMPLPRNELGSALRAMHATH